ncbi:MAG: hypothetical protein CL843_16310 [Crocinitomicaceae bacterium]|nr:hypothetical protein [Crocinitomicaceae bacterium]|tara:strand:- start:6456 stop:7094 length:639 start_codon:yes stop_codon:yes gene_type:complete
MKDVNEMTADELMQLAQEKQQKEKSAAKAAKNKYTNERDAFIALTLAQFSEVSAILSQLKKETIHRASEFRDRAWELQNQEPKDQKQFSIVTEDQQFKLVVENQERNAFNEHAQIAIERIKEILYNKFASRNKAMYNIINDILMKNKSGDYDPKLVAKLRKHEEALNDPEFSAALDELSKSYYVAGSATYVRAYKRDESNKWIEIPMQFSSL